MPTNVRRWFDLPRLLHQYTRRAPLVLVNGLAEQPETWFANKTALSRQFDLKVPEILVYDGDSLHDWIDSGGEVTVEYLAGRLARFLDDFVQRPPYHLVGSSLGSQVILTYATKFPEKVARIVLICPSGFHGDENLPMIEGVRRSNYESLVKSVFHREHFASDELVQALARKFQNRRWKKGVLKTLRATVGHSVGPLLEQVSHPTLLIWGANDRVLSDVPGAIRAAGRILRARQVVIPRCGHAPQIERPSLVNHLISRYLREKLRAIPPALEPSRFLGRHDELANARARFPVAPPQRHSSR
jgi:abhydrolase domain-containing protein 6